MLRMANNIKSTPFLVKNYEYVSRLALEINTYNNKIISSFTTKIKFDGIEIKNSKKLV